MVITIKEIYGYNLLYDEGSRRFVIHDTDGMELAHANTQGEAEIKAKALSKQEFKHISIVKITKEGQLQKGELTSLNKDDKCVWVSMEKSKDIWNSGRRKLNLRLDSGEYYEATETNLKILEAIIAKRETIDTILAEIKALRDTLEKLINLAYFDLK